jgi:ferrous iron transport protein A
MIPAPAAIMKALQPKTLDSFRPGQSARVLRVEGQDMVAIRLVEMGFWPGTRVDVWQRAPFGGPLACQLQGYRLALRPPEAARVVVVPIAATDP